MDDHCVYWNKTESQGVMKMEMQFQKDAVSCQKMVLWEVQNLELTQEVRLPEGVGDTARVLGAWGQCVLRSKEWRRDSVSASGGVTVWVLYESGTGEKPACLESWIPFRCEWDLPEDCPQGKVRIACVTRFVDGRILSAGKLMLRCGVGLLAEAWAPWRGERYQPGSEQSDVELLRSEWPVRLPVEAGEKPFHLEEELVLPPSAPQPEQIVYFKADSAVTDRKVLGSKLVFRGSVNLHILYLSREGQLQGWDLEIPVSQFAELESSYGGDAQADVWLSPTGVELRLDPEGAMVFSGDYTAQYLVDERRMLELTEDAYSPDREVEVRRQELALSVVLDSRKETMYAEASIPADADMVADVAVMPEFPQVRRSADTVELDLPGVVQVLWYGGDGRIRSSQQRFRQQQKLQADSDARITAVHQQPVQSAVQSAGGNVTVRCEQPVQVLTMAGRGLSMVTGLTLGEPRQPDPRRPSLILTRARGRRLWDIARENGSTVESIRRANQLSGEPEESRMLLIPVR